MHSASLATRAELALEDRDFATARDALRNLHSVRPKQIATTRMLLRAERGAGAWDEVLRLATQLGKRDAIAPALAEEYKVQAMIELLGRSAADEDAFERRWRGIDAKDRVHPRIAAAAARHATELGKAEMAREILERALAAGAGASNQRPPSSAVKMGGYQQLVRGEVMRGKFRDSLSTPAPFVPGQPTRVAWSMNDIFHTFKKGHRVMVQVQNTWFPLMDRNPQVFMDINQARPGYNQKATHTDFHNARRPSNLGVGVLKP